MYGTGNYLEAICESLRTTVSVLDNWLFYLIRLSTSLQHILKERADDSQLASNLGQYLPITLFQKYLVWFIFSRIPEFDLLFRAGNSLSKGSSEAGYGKG
jgi:hypothetical protein